MRAGIRMRRIFAWLLLVGVIGNAHGLALLAAQSRRLRASGIQLCTQAEDALLNLLSSESGRGAKLNAASLAEVHRLAAALESGSASDAEDTNDTPLLPGRWRVLYQGKPGGETVSFFSLDSWQRYLAGDGPSPVQNLVSGSSGVQRLYQVVQLEGDSGRILNVVDASPAAIVAIEVQLDGSNLDHNQPNLNCNIDLEPKLPAT